MPWKECSVMDERLKFVARRLAGEPWRNFAGSSAFPARPATRSSIAIRNAAFMGSPTEADVPIAMPPTSLSGGELHSEREARASQLGCSENPRAADAPLLRHPTSGQKHDPCRARSPWPGRAAQQPFAAARAGHPFSLGQRPMSSGVPITKASFCWAIANTVIR